MTFHHLIQETTGGYPSRKIQRLIQAFIIGTVLLGSVGVSLVTSPRVLTLALGFLIGLGVIALFMRWSEIGLVAVPVAGLFILYFGPSGMNVTLLLVAVLGAIWVLDLVTKNTAFALSSSPVYLPLAAFVLSALLSFGIGLLPWFTFVQHAPIVAQVAGLSIFILSAGAFFVAANRISSLRWLKTITWTFIVVGTVCIVGRVVPALRPTWSAIFMSLGSLFWIWLAVLAFSMALFNPELHPLIRLALLSVVVLVLYNVLGLKFSHKSSWIPVLVGLAALIWFWSPKIGTIFGIVTAIPVYHLIHLAIASDSYSYLTRLDAWAIMAKIIRVSPIFGLGFANYHWYTPLYPIRGYFVQFNSHNNYVDLIAQTGVVGLGLFLWFFFQVARVGWRLRHQSSSGFSRAYSLAAMAGLVATLTAAMLGDWVLPFFYNVGLDGFRNAVLSWIFLGGLIALDRINRSEDTKRRSIHDSNHL